MSGEVSQSDNKLSDGSVLAGRDAYVLNFPIAKIDGTRLKKLLDQFRREKETDRHFQAIVEKLAYYKNYAEHEVRRTLEEKLKAGNREAQVRHALRMKELFAKKLLEHQLYESAQAADAYLLGEVCTRFNSHIYPLIIKKAADEVVAQMIESQVIEPVMQLLSEDDCLSHCREEVYGMVYFLTGNCHINWD